MYNDGGHLADPGEPDLKRIMADSKGIREEAQRTKIPSN